MQDYHYIDGEFIIDAYDQKKPFASFLPGIAGVEGIPLWAYYTNRGQGIAGFGVENKHGAILDFVPANMAYKRTELHGFRTFIKYHGCVHELFSSITEDRVQRRMRIEPNGFTLEETNETLGIQAEVRYFTTTQTPYAGLVRNLSLTNLETTEKQIEVVDGLMTFWPYRNDDAVIKSMSNLAVAWFDVDHLELNIPFFKNRSTTEDSATVGTVAEGHFYAAYTSGRREPLSVIVDPNLLFGEYTSLIKPILLNSTSLSDILNRRQNTVNQLPCAFSAFEGTLMTNLEITSILGKATSVEKLKILAQDFSVDHFHQMALKAQEVTATLLADVQGKTAKPLFDAYIQQCYLDNLLRGGYPLVFEGREAPIVYHVYSRIHGDMEREYNNFYVEPAYYSHGNGNFRDVNQNRRNEVYFVKEAGLFNIRQFMDLIQLDGHNPLVIKGSRLSVSQEDISEILKYVSVGADYLKAQLQSLFTPGSLLTAIDVGSVELSVTREQFVKLVLRYAVQEHQATYGHGFWVDHWTYNMDLVDSYLNVYPDALEVLLHQVTFKYFRSPDQVLPRHLKYVLTKDGKVRQYDAVYRDTSRLAKEAFDCEATNWHTTTDQQIVKTSLAAKLLLLALTKMTDFDPSGIGIMMNSDKPGWNDAMNGLPGLFGSGISEVIELKRVVNFLTQGLQCFPRSVEMPKEAADFLKAYKTLLSSRQSDEITEHTFWLSVQEAKEEYLTKVSGPVSGVVMSLSCEWVLDSLEMMAKKLAESLLRAEQLGGGILPTFLMHEAVEYTVNTGVFHPINGLPTVTVHQWRCQLLPRFLEAPARYIKQLDSPEAAKALYTAIKQSELYDCALKMYVTSESLEDQSIEIGRSRAFTPGWLERESVFMHMSYKYLLGLMKAGLYNEFYHELETALPPFMNPEVYGRSTLENSSFIASSRNPNPAHHGRGFVSRLTGTTSEMLSMWIHMMTGSKIFTDDGILKFSLSPVLKSDFFDESAQIAFKLFKNVEIIYKNPRRKNTFGPDCVSASSYTLTFTNGNQKVLTEVVGKDAHAVRDGLVKHIKVLLD